VSCRLNRRGSAHALRGLSGGRRGYLAFLLLPEELEREMRFGLISSAGHQLSSFIISLCRCILQRYGVNTGFG